MDTLIFVLHVISCLFLIGLILLQHGQGSDMGAAFGGASQTVFGSRGPATFLNKLTVIVAVIFLSASVYLSQASRFAKAESVIEGVKAPAADPVTKDLPAKMDVIEKDAGTETPEEKN